MEKIKILADLFQIRTQAHWLHLQTENYEEHKALDTFYNEWLSLTDSFIETYFGKYSRENGSFLNAIKSYGDITSIQLMEMSYNITTQIEGLVDKSDSDLLNIIADMKGLINHTKYLLTLK